MKEMKLKSKCKKDNLKYDLDAEYLASIWTGICPVFKTNLIFIRDDTSSKNDDFAELDRFKPELGYIKGNVTWISARANRIKNNATIDDFLKIIDWMSNWKEPVVNNDISKIIVEGNTLEERKKLSRTEVWNKGKKLGRNLKMSAEKNPNAKLTMQQAREIRQKFNGARGQIQKLAEEYKISRSNIKMILKNLSYREESEE
jgi:hypothetical protein